MSRLERAIEILEALNDYFQEHEGQTVLYSDAQILNNDLTIKEAIAECVGREILEERARIVPRSQRRKIWHNVHTGFNGYIGKRLAQRFAQDRDAAYKWLNEGLH